MKTWDKALCYPVVKGILKRQNFCTFYLLKGPLHKK